MKIAHLCFVEPYLDNWSYQANLLPEYQAKAGHEVVVIAGLNHSPEEYSSYKEIGKHAKTYRISRVRIMRLPLRLNLYNRLVLPKGLYKVLEEEKPDLIFMHSLNNLCISAVSKYKRKHHCKLYADAHADLHNSGKNPLSRYLLHGFFWRIVYLFYQNRLERVFALTDDCVEFAHRFDGISRKKIEILNLGADTDAIRYEDKPKIRKEIREVWGIGQDDFLIATAGKINAMKKVDLLFKAVKALGSEKIKVLVIGPVEKTCQESLNALADGDKRFVFTGWQESARINDFFLASDIVAFPGSQSVLWQEAICCGLPVVLHWWGKTVDYLNIGNAMFLRTEQVEELASCIQRLRDDDGLRRRMAEKAMELCRERLSYDVVARRSLPDAH